MVKVYTSIANSFTNNNNFTAGITVTNNAINAQSGITNSTGHLILAADTGCYVVSGSPLYMCANKIISLANPTANQDAATKCYVDACFGGVTSGIWVDGTDPYIAPCNSCGLCMTGNIVSANSTNCVGCAASPGSFKEFHGLCIEGGTHVCAPLVKGTCVYGANWRDSAGNNMLASGTGIAVTEDVSGQWTICATSTGLFVDGTAPYIVPCNSCGVCAGILNATTCLMATNIYGSGGVDVLNSAGKVAEFGTTCTCLPVIRTKNIHAYTNGACCVGLSACRFLGGYINNIYACRKLVLPVGTNCY